MPCGQSSKLDSVPEQARFSRNMGPDAEPNVVVDLNIWTADKENTVMCYTTRNIHLPASLKLS